MIIVNNHIKLSVELKISYGKNKSPLGISKIYEEGIPCILFNNICNPQIK
jgi:hypothetical protein